MKFLLFILTFTTTLTAQTICPCCKEINQQFDFWIGDWIVRDSLGQEVGQNQISKIEGNCILLEKWTGAKGGTGTSHNYYDKSDSTWNQLWIDNTGNILKLKGNLVAGKMVLKSDLQKGKNKKWYYNQITWTPNEDKTVSQLWEIYNKKEEHVKTIFLGIYHKKDSKH